MIVFLTVRHHDYTVQSLVNGTFGPRLPQVAVLAYEDTLTATELPAATYIFTDIERLSTWERLLAADLFRALRTAGCHCLNDPARVLTRYPLLRALHREGFNPFRAWRLDDGVQLRKFPVFLRNDADHGRPLSDLLHSQAALDAALAVLAAQGIPLSGLLAIEFHAAPFGEGVWAKLGTFRIGDAITTDHGVIEDEWFVKHGKPGLATPEMFDWEYRHIERNSGAALLGPAFMIAGIEYGRADHTTVNGREVVFEINTNPNIAPVTKQRSPVRDQAIVVARDRFAAALWRLDSGDGVPLALGLGERATEHRTRSAWRGQPYRP